jgi:hypothetical protein
MNPSDIVIKIFPPTTTQDFLVYIGTFLVGFEFVRNVDRLQVMLVLLILSPIRHFVNAFPITKEQKEGFKWRKALKSMSFLSSFYATILLPVLIPVSIISLAIFLVTTFINGINDLLNYLWRRLLVQFKDIAKKIAYILIIKNKRYSGLQPHAIFDQMLKTKIPFIPIIGISLIIAAFVMLLVSK